MSSVRHLVRSDTEGFPDVVIDYVPGRMMNTGDICDQVLTEVWNANTDGLLPSRYRHITVNVYDENGDQVQFKVPLPFNFATVLPRWTYAIPDMPVKRKKYFIHAC